MPDPTQIYPIPNVHNVVHVQPTIRNPKIIVGDFTYFSDPDFEQHVTHHYDFSTDRLIIGKFCQLGQGIEFVMNSANHQMNAVSTFPFFIFPDWEQKPPTPDNFPYKGDTIVGNDVWIGQNVTILPGIHIGDGAIIGLNSTVTRHVPPYTIVGGNPAREIRKRFDDELIQLLLEYRWWDLPVKEIKKIAPQLSNPDLDAVKQFLKNALKKRNA